MTRTCPNCGSPVAPGERFCGECGTDLSAYPAQPEEKATTNLDSGATSPSGQDNYSSGATTNTLNTNTNPTPSGAGYTTPASTPTTGVYSNTPQQNYTYPGQQGFSNTGSSTAPAQQSGPGAMFWIGIALLALAVLGCGGIFVLGMASTTTASDSSEASSIQVGTWICSIGLLLLLGIPGGLLLLFGRKK